MSDIVGSVAELGSGAADFISAHMGRTLRLGAKGPCVYNSSAFTRICTGEDHPMANLAYVPNSDDLDAIEKATSPFRAMPWRSSVLLDSKPCEAVEAFLLKIGYSAEAKVPAMAVDIEKIPAMSLPNGYRFERVVTKELALEWKRNLEIESSMPPILSETLSPLNIGLDDSSSAQFQFFVISKGDQIISTSLVCLLDGVAGIYAVGTATEERGKGLGGYVSTEPLRLAARIGYKVGVLQASSMGFPVYQRAGFVDLGPITYYVRQP